MKKYFLVIAASARLALNACVISFIAVITLGGCDNTTKENQVVGTWQLEKYALSLDGGERFVSLISEPGEDLLTFREDGVVLSKGEFNRVDSAKWKVYHTGDSLKIYDESVTFLGIPIHETYINGFLKHIHRDVLGEETTEEYMELIRTFDVEDEKALEMVAAEVTYSRAVSFRDLERIFGEEDPVSFIFLMVYRSVNTREKENKTFVINGHECVDLGLPSGVLWATCNVGANSPEDYGDYFAWGETSSKSDYSWNTYKWSKRSFDNLTKYNNDSSNGIVDNKTTLEPSDDVANVKWGQNWSIPTDSEWNELRSPFNCKWTRTQQNGVDGFKVTSRKNGNSIFLPTAGCRNDKRLSFEGNGYYWSSSLNEKYPQHAWFVGFYSGEVDRHSSNRVSGQSVRPVYRP